MAAATTTETAPLEAPIVRASARFVRVAPRKMRVVADQVRGMRAPAALDLLRFSPRGASVDIYKLLSSAIANAENNNNLDGDSLVIERIFVDEGPTLKRWRPRARGRATRIEKKTCHITIHLTPEVPR